MCLEYERERRNMAKKSKKKKKKKKGLLDVGCIASGRRGVCEIINEAMKNIMREQEECPAK